MLCFLLQKLAQEECLPREPMGSLVFGEQIQEFITKHRGTARLQDNYWNLVFDFGFQRAENLEEEMLGAIQHAPIVEWTPATQVGLRQQHAVAGGFQHVNRRLGGVREEVVIECVRPQEHRCSFQISRLSTSEPLTKRLRGESRNAASLRNTRDYLSDIPQERQLRSQIDQPGCSRSQPRPEVNIPEGVCTERTAPSFVVMGEELRFIGGNIHPDRAIAFASLASEA